MGAEGVEEGLRVVAFEEVDDDGGCLGRGGCLGLGQSAGFEVPEEAYGVEGSVEGREARVGEEVA